MTEDQLESAAEMAVFDAEKLGAREAEAYASSIRGLRAEVVDGYLHYSSIFNEVGVGIRIVEDGATGFSFTNSLTKKDIRDAVERAFHLCKSSRPDFPPATLPKSLGKNQIGDSYDPRIAKINVESVVNLAKEIVDGIMEVDKKHELHARGSVRSVELIRAVDTAGAGIVTESVTMLQGLARATLRSDPLSSWSEWDGVRVGSLDGASEGSTAAENCLSLKNASKLADKPGPMLLDKQALASIMSVAWRVFDASWGGHLELGHQIGQPFLSIYDDEVAPNGISSRGFDDEGLKTGLIRLVESGTVTTLLTNYRWAQKLKLNPTASAYRYGDRPFTASPQIGPTNISIKGDNEDLGEMLKGTRGGIHVIDARNVKLIGKMLTFSAFPAFEISNTGEDSSPVRPVDISIPIEQFFKRIIAVESGKKEYPGVSASAVALSSSRGARVGVP
ncbi:MAG: TldD/PmbA family protein [Thermoprotei archaeon]|nr:TldD/PmbA family protein [TACK group archaeon]